MVENAGRKVVLILCLVLASLALVLYTPLTSGRPPFPLGLDIAGGERLVYSIDFDKAQLEGQVGSDQSKAEILQETINIVKQRVDPRGNREAVVRRIGADRIEISLPKLVSSSVGNARTTSSAELSAEANVTPEQALMIVIAGDERLLSLFPGASGVVKVGDEEFRYSHRIGNQLVVQERGFNGTQRASHPAGSSVVLLDTDDIRSAIENLGEMRFLAVAIDENFRSRGTDGNGERAKLTEWYAKPGNENAPTTTYNALPPEQGGPPIGIVWYPFKQEQGAAPLALRERVTSMLPLAVPPAEWTFTGGDLEKVDRQQDRNGYPAVGFRMAESSRFRFGKYTETLIERQLAIVINGEIATAPQIHAELYGDSIIEGRFGLAERDALVTVLRSGSLKIRPVLEQKETVGASIGDDYVRKNLFGGLVTLALIIAFLCWYYRWLGVWGSLSLLTNLLLLMGAMVTLQGVLTLAGIGGIVLTIGMAVDANILIYERIREEQDKGRKPMQAAKDGFAGALSAIVDGNLTTLISALILYNVGTGTIRGFAVTLSIGILTTMFSALVVTRVLVHYQLKRGVERFEMSHFFTNTSFKFMALRKPALALSVLVVVGGLIGFLALDNQKKLGIDFLGGATVKARTEDPISASGLRAIVGKLPAPLGTADIVDLPGSRLDDGRATAFRFTSKGTGAEDQNDATAFQQKVQEGLGDLLQRGPVTVALATTDSGTSAEGALYFEERHTPADIETLLGAAGFSAPKVEARAGRETVFTFGAGTALTDTGAARDALTAAFEGQRDSNGSEYKLALPIPESSVVGSQVVGEMRDKALLALFWSCLGMLLYIRVRFAEYSYGWGALAADLHDILVTLAAVAFLVAVPWIHVEMNLTMIAAFLTILGYSVNDTIVVYDRIRENLPRVKGTLAEVCDLSVNQTLSRTVITSGTTIAAALIILIFNWGTGNALEGFAFALTFGVVTGTYSSVFVACPIYVWLEERSRRKHAAGGGPASGSRPTPEPVGEPV